MPDGEDKDGGTTDAKTFSQEEYDAAIATATKTGATESYTHFQGVADRQIAEAKNAGVARESELMKSIETMKSEAISHLPEGEQLGAMVKELYKDREGAKSSSPAPDSKLTDKPDVSAADQEKAMRDTIGGHLKEFGVDASKISWGDGKSGDDALKVFLGSLVDEVKANSGTKDDNSKSDDSKNESKGENNVDTSRGAGSHTDINSISPQSLMESNGKWEPIRGMEVE